VNPGAREGSAVPASYKKAALLLINRAKSDNLSVIEEGKHLRSEREI